MFRRLHCLLVVTGIAAVAGFARADWPTDASSPLVLGQALGVGRDVAVVTATDGATWTAWIDGPCFPTFFVQRIGADGSLLTDGGLALVTQEDDCIELAPRLEACSDGTVIASGIGGDPISTPVHRLAPDGSELWAPDVVAADGFGGGVAMLRGLPGGDALVAGREGSSIIVGRYAADGTRVWDPAATFTTVSGTNVRIFALESDGADGAYVLWDAPGAYTRRIYAMRVAADGTPAWAEPLRVVDIPPGSSRHTDPVAVADGTTALVLVWTQGAEAGSTPVPVRVQRLLSDGTMMFDAAGRRVSTDGTRQFSVQVRQGAAGGDLYIAWRDGLFDGQEVRVQRMTLAGERLWGESGVHVTDIVGDASGFTIDWLVEGTLGIAVTDAPDAPGDPDAPWVNVHRVDASGVVAADPWPISGAVPASSIDSAPLDAALAAVWLREANGNQGDIVAQRINADGTLGGPPVTGDATGDGVVDFADIIALLAAWGPCGECPEDLDGNGVVEFVDLLIVLSNWT